MKYSEIATKIRQLRTEKGLTQAELGDRIGVSKSVVSSYENAIHLPPYDVLAKMAKLFGVSCDYLIGCDTARYISTEGLTDTQITAVEKIVEELKKVNRK